MRPAARKRPKEKKSETGLDEIFASGKWLKCSNENKDIRAEEARIDPGASTAFLSGSPHIKDIPSSAEISGSSIALDKNKKDTCCGIGRRNPRNGRDFQYGR